LKQQTDFKMNEASLVAEPDLSFKTSPVPPERFQPDPPTHYRAEVGVAQTVPRRSLYILCIDDDPDVRALLDNCLTHLGHRVAVAGCGKEGLEMFRNAARENRPYEVIITDMGMPDIDGRQVARTIKAECPTMPVIMLTGWGRHLLEDGDNSPGVDIVVSKPPQIRELNELLLQTAARPASRD
jgi:CheY-like chemotaxis protein